MVGVQITSSDTSIKGQDFEIFAKSTKKYRLPSQEAI